jgi:Secretion system C-terminal sorting domain
MKTTLKIFLLLLLNNFIFSQNQITNGDFEKWTKSTNGTDSLQNWTSSNAVVISPVRSLVRILDTFTNNNYLQLNTAPFGFVQWNTVGILVNGKAKISYDGGGGTLRGGTRYVSGGGTPVIGKPTKVTGRYYYELVADHVEYGLGEVITTKYNKLLNKRDTVGIGKRNLNIQKNFTTFTINITDLMPSVLPDTITTIFYSSGLDTVADKNTFASLFLDDINITYATSKTKEIESKNNFYIFPNPSNGFFNIELLNTDYNVETFEIYSILGQLVKKVEIDFSKNIKSIDLSKLGSGTYFIRSAIQNSEVKKIIIQQ